MMAVSLPLLGHLSPRALALVAMLAILIVAVPIVAALTARRFARPAVAAASKIGRYLRTIAVLWLVTALAIYALRLYGQRPSDVGVRAPHAPIELLAGLVVAAALLLLSAGRSEIGPDYARRIRVVVPASTIEWALFVGLAATAGMCEEFLYRGYALVKVAQLLGSLSAGVVISSVAFGLAHSYQGRMGMIGASVAGFLYALVFLATGSLLPCMIGHFAQDIGGALLLARRLPPVPQPTTSSL